MKQSRDTGAASAGWTGAPAADRAALDLLAYCRANDWSGYDPYDALNSRLFASLPFLDSRWPRLVMTQLLKRAPFNLRPLLGVPKTCNPKALALFLTSLCKLEKLGLADRSAAAELIDRLAALRSIGSPHWCWGYSFPWQTRTIVVPRGAPNLVCTTFAAGALLDAHEQLGDARCLEMAESAGHYLADELYYTRGETVASFSYPLPGLESKVHNANLLAAALLCRLVRHGADARLLEPALKAARYSASRQNADGSWAYGEAPTQSWIDNFHTGFNLSALRSIARSLDTAEFSPRMRRGYEFYRAHFVRDDGAPRYFHDRTYPIDIHCVAQTILTLVEFADLDPTAPRLARSVYGWAMRHMRDAGGCFYYRVLPFMTVRIPYMRWSQAWMLLALAALAEHEAGLENRASKSNPSSRAIA